MPSINTNVGAMVALQNLNATSSLMTQTQNRISTGLNVSSTKDDSAVYAIAQSLRGNQSDMKAVTSSLNTAKSTVDVAVNGAQQISDILNQLGTLAKQSAAATDDASRAAYDRDFKAYVSTINTIVQSSGFNGVNLIDNSGTPGSQQIVTALASYVDTNASSASNTFQDSTATPTPTPAPSPTPTPTPAPSPTPTPTGYTPINIKVGHFDLSANGAVLNLGANASIASQSDASAMVTTIEKAKNTLATALSNLGSASRQIDTQLTFNSKLADTITSGIGNLVDADLAKESANLQSLQVKQQLGAQALSIANQAPQSLLSLFR